MADKRFMFFENYMETANKLPDEMRLKYYDSIMNYVFKGEEPSDPVMAALINSIKLSLDKVEKRGGNHNPTGQNQYNEVKVGQNEVKVGQSGQSFKETETETEIRNGSNEKESVKEKVAKAPTFKKPTLEEVKAYCEERGNSVDAERWMDYYTANGWKVGRNPMKDWKATVRTWEKGEQRKPIEIANSQASGEPRAKTVGDLIEEMWAEQGGRPNERTI